MASLKRRGKTYHLQWYEGGRQRRRSLGTDSLQIAKEKLRQFESALHRGEEHPLPTRTPIGEVVEAFVAHMRAHRPEGSWRRDLSYLRESFGEVCPALQLATPRARHCRARRRLGDQRRRLWPIGATYFEEITTAAVSEFLVAQVRAKGLAPKTANRYREVLCKLVNWAMRAGRVRMPMDRNPVLRVERYREKAPEIRYLTLAQVDEQLRALDRRPLLRLMVATLIYAGLRRDELLWLRVEDFVRTTAQAPNGLLRVEAKTVGREAWQPKTKRNRAVPISSDLLREFDAQGAVSVKTGWLFPSPEGKRWNPDNFSRSLRVANKAAGLPWTCLDFRHTFGSQLAQRGVSLYQIAALMGNSPDICRRHYASLVTEDMAALVDFGRVV